MKTRSALFILSAVAIVACHTSRKNTTSTTSTQSTATTPTVSTTTTAVTPTPAIVKTVKTADGVYEPGDEELTAIKEQYKDATIEQLKEGYILYAKSACVSCHGTVNIYTYPQEKWPWIIQDMAYRAKLTTSQKDAVLRYVYAIKATDPNKK